jgi:cellulose biosynthesis protein BcsQ
MGNIVTFYSYKGGVGRSMALANTAVMLAKWGHRVLMIDWDLEAPGLENFFFKKEELPRVLTQKGLLDFLLLSTNDDEAIQSEWKNWLHDIQISELNLKGSLQLMTAGQRDIGYNQRLRDFDVSFYYENKNGGQHLLHFREVLKADFDFVLIDSRTGVTDHGGITTIQMPDLLVLPCTATEQSLQGVKKVALSAQKGQQHMPDDRELLRVLPLPARFDSTQEFKESQQWLDRFAEELDPLLGADMPQGVSLRDFMERIKIPYLSYFSFGEKLPVVEQGTNDPQGLGFAYETLAALIGRNMQDLPAFWESRDLYVAGIAPENGSGEHRYDLPSSNRKTKVAVLLSGSLDPYKLYIQIHFVEAYFSSARKQRFEVEVFQTKLPALRPGEKIDRYEKKIKAEQKSFLENADIYLLLLGGANHSFYFGDIFISEDAIVYTIDFGNKVIIPIWMDKVDLIHPTIKNLASLPGYAQHMGGVDLSNFPLDADPSKIRVYPDKVKALIHGLDDFFMNFDKKA